MSANLKKALNRISAAAAVPSTTANFCDCIYLQLLNPSAATYDLNKIITKCAGGSITGTVDPVAYAKSKCPNFERFSRFGICRTFCKSLSKDAARYNACISKCLEKGYLANYA